jgi:hypothetical protein
MPPKCPRCGTKLPPWRKIAVAMPEEAAQVYDDAVALLRAEGLDLHKDPGVAAGQAIEMLAASYLAGAPTTRGG